MVYIRKSDLEKQDKPSVKKAKKNPGFPGPVSYVISVCGGKSILAVM
jgi:hypothetical protein